MASLRTPETEQKYREHIERGGLVHCPLCRIEPLKTFTYWKIIPNDFPYDKVAERHDMVVPLRHVAESDLTEEEKKELKEIKDTYVASTYVYVIEATKGFRSVPAHFHLHLITLKDLG